MRNRPIPEATVARLPIYLRSLLDLAENRGQLTVSSEDLARMAGVNAAKVRKDLSYLGSYGTRGVGYDVEYLLYQISRELGLTQDWPAAIIGIGNLGRALASYKGFSARGFCIKALFDVDEEVVGSTFADLEVKHLDDLKDVVTEQKITIGIIATPPAAAQEVAEHLVDAGVKSILNFAPGVVNVPPDVTIRKVDLSIELQILSFYQQRTQAVAAAREASRRLASGR
jgi:redox-sensing transcriptional repressor